MKSNLRFSNRLSGFRFSLASPGPLRSPVSPLSPPRTFENPKSQPTYHADISSNSSNSPPTTSSNSDNDIKEKTLNTTTTITALEPPTPHYTFTDSLLTPRALPSPRESNNDRHGQSSPITPWQATFHRNAATTDQETRYLTTTTRLRYVRLLLTTLLLALSATSTGLTSDILHRYYTTNLPHAFSLSLWPTDTDTTPTILTLISSVITLALSLSLLTIHIIPSPNPRTSLTTTLFTILTLFTTPLTLAAILLSTLTSPSPILGSFISKTLTTLLITTGPLSTTGLTPNGLGSNPKPETIQSFTCTLSHTAAAFRRDALTLSLPYPSSDGDMIPTGFQKICVESQVGAGLVIGMCVLAGIGIGVAMWSWSVERGIERLRGEREVISLGSGSKGGSRAGSTVAKGLEMPNFVEKRDLERGSGK